VTSYTTCKKEKENMITTMLSKEPKETNSRRRTSLKY